MPLDAVLLRGLTRELQKSAVGAKIDRVQQPEKEVLLLTLRTNEGNRKLMLSASVSGARVHFTAQSFENPPEPPMFCMLLRKHLVGARIESIEQPDLERVVILTLRVTDELGELAAYLGDANVDLILELKDDNSFTLQMDASGNYYVEVERGGGGGPAQPHAKNTAKPKADYDLVLLNGLDKAGETRMNRLALGGEELELEPGDILATCKLPI